MQVDGPRLALNLDTVVPGHLRVGLLNADGNPIEGFGAEDCDVLRTNATRALVTWKGKSDLNALQGREARLSLSGERAKLFSFYFTGQMPCPPASSVITAAHQRRHGGCRIGACLRQFHRHPQRRYGNVINSANHSHPSKKPRETSRLGSVVLCHHLLAALLLLAPHAQAVEPRVYRTFMPEAGPSAFGVVLGPELALCYDPLRGGVNQAWRGSLDLTPTLRAKINQPAVPQGEVFYRETTAQPMRVESPEKTPVRRFKGYRYEKNTVIFEFTLDGVLVRETLRTMQNGRGFERAWSLPKGAVLFFHAEAQPSAAVTITGAEEIQPGLWRHQSVEGKTFSMTIQPIENE